MKLFMVIYIAGNMGGTVGPLPYGLSECQARAIGMMAQADHSAITPEGYTTKDVRLECEYHANRPELKR